MRHSFDIFNKLKEIEKDKIYTELDNKISVQEISDAISSLKNNKASSFDSILNEMLKCGQTFILNILCKLFNTILSSGKFPKSWSNGIIVPIFKNGSKNEPANYGGLTIGSNVCKLFTKILNKRLDKFCSERHLICPEQIGFCKGKRTSDHIFVLKTLIDKYTHQSSRRLYSCFIDFRRAFEIVRHEELFYKLRRYGVSDLFYNVIKDMYLNIDLCVKVNSDNLSESFQSHIGVRQGDNLSPNLFKLFINDLPDIFDSSCHPVSLNITKLNCLMYADDVILLSETAEGLQNCLLNLHQYCENWGLEVNIKKTKSVVFNRTGRLEPVNFLYGNKNIDNVRKYSYLGVTFSNSGSFSEAKQELYKKGLKAFFKFRKCFEHHKPKIRTLLHVFDHTIKPVLLYGSEIWGMFSADKLNKLKDSYFNRLCYDLAAEKIHTKFCKYVLEVGRRSTNIAVLGELGRYPLFLEVLLNMIKYLSYLSKSSSTDLLYDAFVTSKLLHSENKACWYKCIREIIDYFNIDLNKIINLKCNLKKYIYHCFSSKYKSVWSKELFNDNKHVSSGNKLRTYRLFKDKYIFEPYLNWGSYSQRRIITKFRISSHNLEIERGRYKNIPAEQRCKLCNLDIEDEIHFLLECPKLANSRCEILERIYNKYINIKLLDSKSKFIWLLSAEDHFVYSQLSLLLTHLNDMRQKILSNCN